jgi:hypothetical protein
MKRSFSALAFFILAANAADAPRDLSGTVSGAYPAAGYTVSGDVVVPPGKTMSLDAGAVLRFENFSGITVRGSLICKGTPSRPVIFTSQNDDQNSGTGPEPFDWNGIKAAPGAGGVVLEHCVVTYSTFGVNIESAATPVTMVNVSFHHNGSASVTREKKMMPVIENIPVSYTWPETPAPKLKLKKKLLAEKKTRDAAVTSGPSWRKPVRFAGAAVGIAGAALWLTGHVRAEHYDGLIKPGLLISTAAQYKDSRDRWVIARNAGIGVFGVGAAAFAITFVF